MPTEKTLEEMFAIVDPLKRDDSIAAPARPIVVAEGTGCVSRGLRHEDHGRVDTGL